MTENQEHTAAPDMNPDEYYPEDEPDVPVHERFRRRIFKMVSVGVVDDLINQMYDIISTLALIINLLVTILNTYSDIRAKYALVLDYTEAATVAFFAVDYFLRIYTANCLYPKHNEFKSILKYMLSFTGIIDFLSFFSVLSAVVFSGRGGCIQNVQSGTNTAAFQNQCLLRFTECYHRGSLEKETTDHVLCFYDICDDACLQSLYVQY